MLRSPARRRPAAARRGFTLAELVVSLTVLGLVGAVGAGLSAAALRAKDHAFGNAACATQARAAGERVRSAVAAARVLDAPGGAVPGVVAVDSTGSGSTGPGFVGEGARLVVWCGGRGDAAAGFAGRTLSPPGRLPRAEELLVFTADPARPWRLTECWCEGDATPVDLWSPALPTRLDELLKSPTVRPLTLCDRVRVRGPAADPAACVRFAVEARPRAAEIAAARADGTPAAWLALPWVNGSAGANAAGDRWGVRSVRVRAGVQLTPLDGATSRAGAVRPRPPFAAVPFTLPAARTAVFRPD